MTQPQPQKLVVVVTHNHAQDKASVAFTIANAALSGGMQVAVFLTSDGVTLARDGSTDLTQFRPLKGLTELIDQFTENGGTLWVCNPCFTNHGLKAEDNVPKALVTGAGTMIEWIQAGASTLCF